MSTALMVFTRDLRVRDNPALVAACESAEWVVPLFVRDDALPIASSANRARFVDQSLDDLDASLRRLGSRLVVRHGPWVDTVAAVAERLAVGAVHVADDVSGYARRRLARLQDAIPRREVHTHPGVTVVEPGVITPAGAGSYRVFTPYHRRWLHHPWRPPLPPPERVPTPADLDLHPERAGPAPRSGACSPDVVTGGETAALERLRRWAAAHLADYPERHDDVAGDATSRISASLHAGCLSPLEVATRLRDRDGGAAFVRQLCWRDFFHQVLHDHPEASTADLRSRGDRWHDDPEGFEAWREGRTGYPFVDAAMRQLTAEGFVHNRARMAVASFLTKDLYVDWRLGAAHFMDWLVDGDVAVNQLNWQWVAGTGTDANRHRIFNPVTQGRRFDPQGRYIRRYVPELAHLAAPDVHWPDEDERRRLGYPAPIVDHGEAIALYRAATGGR